MGMAALVAGLVLCPLAGHAGDKIWTDPATGFAFGGYDVVSYWSEEGPVLGNGQYEVQLKHVTWRFRNQGNCEEFLKYPDVYAPQFSGYGAYAISEGNSPQGNPQIWAIADKKLYFFFSRRSKIKWQLARHKYIKKALVNWPALKQQIASMN